MRTPLRTSLRRVAVRVLPEVVLSVAWHNPLFDAAWYRRTYPDVAGSHGRPERHYRRHGVREGRDPNPVFHTSWYLQANPDVIGSGLNPLDHYLLYGAQELRDPGPAFSTRTYLDKHPELERSATNPLAHFLAAGMPERERTPLSKLAYPGKDGRPPRDGSALRLLLVLHDTYNHGAQQNALHLAQALSGRFHAWLDIVLLGDGELRPDVARTGRIHDFAHDYLTTDERRRLLADLHADGVNSAICNTTISGGVADLLDGAGFRITQLIHELPGIIRSYGLEPSVDAIRDHADRVVFASSVVQRGFESISGSLGERAVIRPQGLYRRAAPTDRWPELRAQVRAELEIPEDRPLVLAVGWADHRKGIDLFVDVAGRSTGNGPKPVFVWLGCEQPSVVKRATEQARELGCMDDVRLVPRVADPERFYAAADLFLLTSREDPFPSVVMEAMSHEVPVIAFADATGASDLIAQGGGRLVPFLDTAAMAAEVGRLLADESERERTGAEGRRIVERDFDWLDFVYDLLEIAGEPRRRVSVVVPNYNHARYLELRLGSIFGQGYPVREVLLLDDASTDDSLDTVKRLAEERGWELRIVANERNSGSVFRQWRSGVALASGELVWVAESDDVAEPGFLAAATRAFEDEAVRIAYTESRQIDAEGRLLGPDYRAYVNDLEPGRWNRSWTIGGRDALARWFAVRNPIPNVSAAVFRRDAIAAVLERDIDQITRLRVAGDYLSYVRLLLDGGSLAFVAEALNNHRRDASSVTQQAYGAQIVREIAAVQRVVRDRVDVPAEVQARGRAYLGTLYKQFGLPADLLEREPPETLFPDEERVPVHAT